MKKNSGEQVKKSRYGRVSTKRKFDEECDNSLGRKTVIISTKKNKSKLPVSSVSSPASTSNNVHSNTRNNKVNEFNIGDIVWAKPGKYPVWPGIVISDPNFNIHYKEENNVTMLHIYYCNDAYKRNWIRINQIFEFVGKDSMLREFPKLTTHVTRSKIKSKWNRAVDEATYLTMINREDRIKAFFSNTFLHNIEMTNNAQNKKPSIEQSENDQLSAIYNQQPAIENQQATIENLPSTSCNLQINTNLFDDDFKQNITNHEVQYLNYKKEHPRVLIPELCRLFYLNGWVTGTGGGISIKYENHIYIAPSGVQKERIQPEDLFVQDIHGVDVELPPPEKNFSKSQCTPIFMCSYTLRDAGAVIHIHSLEVVKLCLLSPGKDIRINDLEIIKGIYNEEKGKYYDNDEEVVIPIIENSKYERDLVGTFKLALRKYPMTSAVIVRNHGMYVWGKDWQSAKTQCECYDYAFKVMIFKKLNRL
ncbi:Class II aldolase/adducin N-terminal,Methylthioribulose-1-phosphate dehydratase,PWWP [Cinara cedri]|uniref:Probable methylthioribulose-1-phosphate dehydratase n=1 Tax=Cinara cedri TaxID=506608 RepID=A0A5E4MKD3_9HEMI|nr:Class II aldolase/adducin N-terminal,Methylthioribulose-1-phosphate dehydratase,PWWP [Cinara cedri]